MGLYLRGKTYWVSVTVDGRRLRQSCETSDRKIAEAILDEVQSEIERGQFFDKREQQTRTFRDMMERYVAERSILKAAKSSVRDESALKHLLPIFGNRPLVEVTPRSLAAYKAQRRME